MVMGDLERKEGLQAMLDALSRHKTTRRVVFSGALLAVALGLAACGVPTGALGESSGTQVATQTVILGTPTSTAGSGSVRLVLGQAQFHPGDRVTVTIENGLAQTISATDHHASCTLIQLDKLVNGSWKPAGICRLMTPTLVVDLPAGSVTPQMVGLPTGQDAGGTYRMMLMYGVSGQSSSGQGGPAYSATFIVD